LLEGDCRDLLPRLPAASVQCVVTSPPYWGLRDYGTASWDGGDPACDHRESRPTRTAASAVASTLDGGKGNTHRSHEWRGDCGYCGARRIDQQLGLEATPEAYVEAMVGVFREVRRVLRDDGTLWLNMGDSYGAGGGNYFAGLPAAATACDGAPRSVAATARARGDIGERRLTTGLKPKDLVGMPWRLAFALQADGWFLRADIIWAKRNPMPESVTDRPTKAHEYVFLLSKAARYFYDADAVRERIGESTRSQRTFRGGCYTNNATFNNSHDYTGHAPYSDGEPGEGRNLRSVWTLASEPTPESHFATFPTALASRCIQAGSSERGCCAACGAPWARIVEQESRPNAPSLQGKYNGLGVHRTISGGVSNDGRPRVVLGWQPSCACDASVVPCTVLDPFAGTGTVGAVAEQLGRHSILLELSPAYVRLADRRTAQLGLFTQRATA
jgi:DNA modification methylase